MEISIVCRSGCRRLTPSRIRFIAEEVLRDQSYQTGEVTILLTRDREMRKLNCRFRGLDRPTDVLSFPGDEAGSSVSGYLGDLAISVDSADRQAQEVGWTVEEEIQFLLIHGLLHLLGYDHETDRGRMNRLQSRLVRQLVGKAPGQNAG